jgi:hypothetical protein
MTGPQTPYNISNPLYAQLEQTIQDLQARLAQVENSNNHESFAPIPIEKNNTPDPFDGLNKSKFRDFMSHVKLIMQLQPHSFTSDRSKSLYVATLLRGPAFSWIQPHLDDHSPQNILNNFAMFETQLSMLFGDKHQSRSAATALNQLKQTSSVSSYAAEFHRLSKMTNWNDAALIDKFLDGLLHQTRKGLIGQNIPNTIVDLIDQATQVDELSQVYSNISGKYTHNNYYNNYNRNQNSNSMDVDFANTRHTPITDNERTRRLRERLCLYCGEANHVKRYCPNAPKRPRPNYDINSDSGKDNAQSQ